MPKSKYVELIFPNSKDIPQHSLAGYISVSDYTSDGNRHVFLKRNETDTPVRKERKKVPKEREKATPVKVAIQTGFTEEDIA